MTACYPLTTQLDYTELRYSLRSLEKYLQVEEVLIVGDHVPEWLTNVTQIHLPDIKGKKQWSIRRKILAALEYAADEILFMNDDIYFLQPVNEFPYYWHGYLKNYNESGSKPLFNQLEYLGRPTKHFDGHMPIIYEKIFKSVSEMFTDDCIIKSMYCNNFRIEGVFLSDCKLLKDTKPEVIREFIKDRHCFSSGSYSINSALIILQELFPEPSKYEI